MSVETSRTGGGVITSCIVIIVGLYLGHISTTGSKTQTIRLLDIFVIGPLMIFFGATTITYNLKNYLAHVGKL